MTDENKVAETVSADEKVDGASAGAAGVDAACAADAAGTAGATPSLKRGRRKVTAVVATVAVVLVAAGAGFMVWHDQPSFCNAICHTPMDGYLTTYESTPGEAATDKWGNQVADASSMLAPVHAQEGITCVGCHVPQMSEQVTEGLGWLTGSYSVVQTADERFVPEEKTLSDLTAARGIASEAFCLNSGCHVNDDGSIMTRDDLVEKTSYMKRNPHVQEHGEVACSECHKAHRASTVYCSKCHSSRVGKARARERAVSPPCLQAPAGTPSRGFLLSREQGTEMCSPSVVFAT